MRIITILFITLNLLTFLAPLLSHADERYRKFTDPKKGFEMPKEWVENPIKYEDSYKDSDMVVTLDQHLYPGLVDLIKEYSEKNNIKISVQEGTCGISAGMIRDKKADIAGYCCPAGEADRLPGIRFHTVGISPILLLVHPDNKIDNVTLQEARDIFAGNIVKWSSLKSESGESGANAVILPMGRLHCKARPGHWRLLLDNEEDFSLSLQEVGSIPEMIKSVADNKNVIGYETMWMVQRYGYAGKVKSLKIDGHDPNDKDALLKTKYPLYRTYAISTWEDEKTKNPHTDKFVEYILENVKNIDKRFNITDASSLRDEGWVFYQNELIGEPEKD